MVNLFLYENHIRLFAGIILVGLASFSQMWWIAIIGIFFIYTGAARYCPVFHVFGVNADSAKRKYHLSLLPGHNPEPVYLFDKTGDLVFRNDAAKNILPELSSMETLQKQKSNTEFNAEMDNGVFCFRDDNKNYLLRFQSIKNSKFIAGYGFDVTKLIEADEEVINTQKELIFRMGEIGETRSKETGNHVKRVAEYSKQLALLIGLAEDEAELLKMASPMHDIGKVAIPDNVLLKPGKLDAAEWEVMKTHASIGYELLRRSDRPILQAASIVAGQHHEKWDGSGYPNGLVGKDIHVYGRITAVADVFDALGSERVYKKAWPLDKILALLEEQKERHFDPQLVDLFCENLDIFLKIRDEFRDDTMLKAS